MIQLAQDCLFFELPNGESLPLSADMMAFEVCGDSHGSAVDNEFVNHAAAAVFHYFKHDQQRPSVTMGEFCQALEKVLQAFTDSDAPPPQVVSDRWCESNLALFAAESCGSELLFFTRLRAEVRDRLRDAPDRLRFCGLRACVKDLAGARRWSRRCRGLRDQIVEFLRQCVQTESRSAPCSLRVD